MGVLCGKFRFWRVLCCCGIFMAGQGWGGIDIGRLADICEKNEKAIQDISIEYTWYNDPPYTLEDIAGTDRLIVDGRTKQHLTVKYPFEDFSLYRENYAIVNQFGESFEKMRQSAFNKNVFKSFDYDLTRERISGFITDSSKREQLLTLTPMGFSVLRTFSSPEKVYLSEVLKREGLTIIDTEIEEINGFDTIKADILNEHSKIVVLRVYFSVDHGYAPVRFVYTNGPDISNVALTINIHSLEKVAEGIWFPTKGTTEVPGAERIDVYEATGDIIVNQGLDDDFFDIDFPPGTEVYDEIMDIRYLIDPTEEQAEKFAENQKLLAEYERRQASQGENESDKQERPNKTAPCCPASSNQDQASEIDQEQSTQNKNNRMAWLIAASFAGIALVFIKGRKKTAK